MFVVLVVLVCVGIVVGGWISGMFWMDRSWVAGEIHRLECGNGYWEHEVGEF